MSESTIRKLITRGVPTKILNFDGPSFSLQITQGELDAGLAKNMTLEKRTKARHENLKETQVEKSMKETRMAKTEKRKIHISEASSVKGKEVEASKSLDKVEEKGIKFFVKHQPIFAPHISVYTNTDIVSKLKENLTPGQYKKLGNTCFGNFLQMKRCEVQHQLFRCFMALQLEGTPNVVFPIHVNGTSLHFTLREFALVTGLKCVGNDANFEFSERVPNRLIETYFGGANLVKKKHLMKCFADKNWCLDNDGDALKICLLYFIHTFIFSSEKNSTTIPRLHFDLVESGRYSEYHWGLKAFEMLKKSISKKMDAQKKYYRIVGMTLAMQVWFYECCSDVDPKIALRVDDVVPRILNWRTTENQPNFAYLMNGMFNDNGNMKYTVAYRYIFDALIPAVILAVVSAIIFAVIFSHETAYICRGCIQQYTVAFSCINMLHTLIVYKDIHPSNIELVVIQIPLVGADVENKPIPAHSDKSGEDSDDFSPTTDLQCKKKHVASVGPSSSPPHKKSKEHERHPNETEYQSKIPPVCVSEFGQNILHDNQLPDSKNDEVSSLRKDINSFKEYVVGEFKSLRTLINDNFKMLSDHIQQNQQNESLHQRKELVGRRDDGIDTDVGDNVEKPMLNAQCMESRGEGNTTSEVSCNIPSTGQEGVSTEFYVSQFELDDKFLPSQIPETRIVIHNSANKKKLNQPQYHLIGIGDQVDGILRFMSLTSTPQHIDVIFYYLRKKEKYNQTSNFKYTTVDCIFKTRIAETFDRYADTDSNANVAKEEDMVLVVVSFKERCIKVYDSYRFTGHDAYVASDIDKLDKFVPLYLSISGFYRDSQGIDWFTYSAYTDKSHNDPFEVFFISDLPQQKAGSMDCGVHVASYAEFLSTIGEIPQTAFDSNLLRQRYGTLLWDYAMQKIDADAISENKAPSKIGKQITESDSKMQIVLE
ncbi:uncharacterized protein LOC142180951 [Nicotiana tabacum]|uniref:Uncharacterized protein LOC142180951 n=1 Tax=Nicotiana tabacum TaxID=4097 RepID=A0AC58UI46_TOBAC